jgi:hypothetical protein
MEQNTHVNIIFQSINLAGLDMSCQCFSKKSSNIKTHGQSLRPSGFARLEIDLAWVCLIFASRALRTEGSDHILL